MRSHLTSEEQVALLGLEETLGMAFGICVLIWAVWVAYQLIIRHDRESRRRRIDELREGIHRNHWKELARKALKKYK